MWNPECEAMLDFASHKVLSFGMLSCRYHNSNVQLFSIAI